MLYCVLTSVIQLPTHIMNPGINSLNFSVNYLDTPDTHAHWIVCRYNDDDSQVECAFAGNVLREQLGSEWAKLHRELTLANPQYKYRAYPSMYFGLHHLSTKRSFAKYKFIVLLLILFTVQFFSTVLFLYEQNCTVSANELGTTKGQSSLCADDLVPLHSPKNYFLILILFLFFQ